MGAIIEAQAPKLRFPPRQSFAPTLNFPELKTGDKLYFRGGPDAENENWKSLKTSQSLI